MTIFVILKLWTVNLLSSENRIETGPAASKINLKNQQVGVVVLTEVGRSYEYKRTKGQFS